MHLYILVLLAASRIALAQCYYPNGDLAVPDSPCDSDADVSSCCGGSGTECMSNRLCQDPNGRVIRGSCTDKTWTSPECGRYCLGSDRGGTDLESCEYVTDRDTDYCCVHAPGAGSCCETGNGRFKVLPESPGIWARWVGDRYSVVGSVIEYDTTSSEVVTSTRTTSRSSTSTASETKTMSTTSAAVGPPDTSDESGDNSNDSDGDGLSIGAKAGIGVGAGVGVLLLLAVIWLGYKHYQHRKAAVAAATMHPTTGYHGQGYYQAPMQQDHHQQAEISKPQYWAHELPGHAQDHQRSELST